MAAMSHLITADEAREKVIECMELADAAAQTSCQIMFQHMTQTWKRIARDVEQRSSYSQ
jgi:hypothetical protein